MVALGSVAYDHTNNIQVETPLDRDILGSDVFGWQVLEGNTFLPLSHQDHLEK